MTGRIRRSIAALIAVGAAITVGVANAQPAHAATAGGTFASMASGYYDAAGKPHTTGTYTTGPGIATPNGDSGNIGNGGSPSGCHWVHVWINQYAGDGTHIYTDNEQLNWCHDGTWVRLPISVSDWASNVNGWVAKYDGVINRDRAYYYYNPYHYPSGYYAKDQSKFETSCLVIKNVCLNSHYPIIRIYGHMDGTAHWSWSS